MLQLTYVICCGILAFSCTHDNVEAVNTEEALGEKLFFDPILSRDSTISCGSCHKPANGFADTSRFSRGVGGRTGTRNTPAAMNQVDRNAYFWDGRAATLEEQALGPMENHVEMDFPLTLTIRRLARNEFYRESFRRVYGQRPDRELLAKAISAYERTLETADSPFDRYVQGDDTGSYPESAKRGLALFNGKGHCFDCHFGPDFSGNDQFRNIGLYNGQELDDKGRYGITGRPEDLGRFKVPGLRNVSVTGPYMHNGMFRSLREVLAFYNNPDSMVKGSINRDTLLRRPLGLTQQELKDLELFLTTLTDSRFTRK